MDRYNLSKIYDEYSDISADELSSEWDEISELEGIDLDIQRPVCRLQDEFLEAA